MAIGLCHKEAARRARAPSQSEDGQGNKRARVEESKGGKVHVAQDGGLSEDEFESSVHLVPVHPLGVQPAGSALLKDTSYLAAHHRATLASLGSFARLPDALLLHLLSYVEPAELAKLEQTSRAMRIYATHEPLWREALLKKTGGRLSSWQGTWKATFAAHESDAYGHGCKAASQSNSPFALYSDDLFLPLQLASLPLRQYVPNGKQPTNRIERVDMSTLSKQDFVERFANPSKPCLLTHAGDQATPRWTVEDVRRMYTTRRIRAEALSLPMNAYAAYAETCQRWEEKRADWVPDESPFYLFDPTLARTMQQEDRFVVPEIFRESPADKTKMASDWDLFGLLHDRRPDNAWIIAGPQRSGSGWHVDPNRTSAYNTVLSGRKLWMLLPPHITPPGVYVSEDGGTVTAPLSIAEWLRDFWQPCLQLHGTGRKGHGRSGTIGDGTLLVDVCHAGETIYVPAGWKHLVINLDESVAFTQNFVSPAELPAVLDFLKNTPDQISGFRIRARRHADQGQRGRREEADDESDPELDELPDDGVSEKEKLFGLFVERLEQFDKALCETGLEGMRRLEEQRQQDVPGSRSQPHRVRAKKTPSQSWWQALKSSDRKEDERQNDSAADVATKRIDENNSEAGAGSGLFAGHLDQLEELDDVPW